jgi:hypothetical protein
MPFAFSAAASSSARMAGGDDVLAKNARNAGWFQCVMPGRIMRSKSPKIRSIGSPLSGPCAGSASIISFGCMPESTGYLSGESR